MAAPAYQIEEALLPKTPDSPQREERKVPATSGQPGRKRAASANTRVFG